MVGGAPARYSCIAMRPAERKRARAAAARILGQGGWCVLEVCVDVGAQRWETRELILATTADAVVDVVADEVGYEPQHDARLTGFDRRLLRESPEMGTHLCYLAEDGAGAEDMLEDPSDRLYSEPSGQV
jgi:hypothetical protein